MNEILSNCKKLPNHIIKFFIPLINLIIEEKDIDLYGNENLSTITQLLCFYISKDSDEVLINFIDKEGKHEYINYILKFIHFIIMQCDKANNDYYEYTYIFYICNNLFDRYKNKVEIILQDILELIIAKYKNNKNQKMLDYLCLLLSISFIYFPEQCLIYFQKKCCGRSEQNTDDFIIPCRKNHR